MAVTNAFAAVRLLPMSDRDKDAEILVLRHQVMVVERQLGADRVEFGPEDRAFLAALLAPLPREFLRLSDPTPVLPLPDGMVPIPRFRLEQLAHYDMPNEISL
ncbi:hypothetical protein ABT009_12020 [Streptomyces sp. NPDC002896]|uniref:hypothetical protein n=1 Tax=Streptomyces sp. NPDC002896 TaxID=3154438 RepID=UPI0033277F32